MGTLIDLVDLVTQLSSSVKDSKHASELSKILTMIGNIQSEHFSLHNDLLELNTKNTALVQEVNSLKGGNNAEVEQKSPLRTGISTTPTFDVFYERYFENEPLKNNCVEIFLCGGTLSGVFQPSSYRSGWDISASKSCVNDINNMDLDGQIWKHIKQKSYEEIKFNVLILSPFNPQLNTISEFQKIEKENRFAKEDVYNSLYVMYWLSKNENNISFHIKLLLNDAMTYSLHNLGNEILVINYLLSGLAGGSPFQYLSNNNSKEKILFDKYTDNLNSYFSSNKLQNRTMELDMEQILLRDPRSYSEFKEEIDYVIKSGAYKNINNPHHIANILLSKYFTKVEDVRGGKDVFPVQLEINAIDACNQSCRWCISENLRNKKSGLEINEAFREFLRNFRAKGGEAITWSGGGEPTLHPDLPVAMSWAAEEGLKQGLITNGDYSSSTLNESIKNYCEWVRFSLDTVSEKKYKKYRGAKSLSSVCKNIEYLADDIELRVGINANISEWNKKEIKDIYRKSQLLGADYLQIRPILKTPFSHKNKVSELSKSSIEEVLNEVNSISDCNSKTELILSMDKFLDLSQPGALSNPYSKIFDYSGCKAHNLLPVLDCDGNLSVCMYHLLDERFTFGNIYKESFERIWLGEKRKSVKEFCDNNLNHENDNCQICCKGHEINKIICSESEPVKIENFESSNFL